MPPLTTITQTTVIPEPTKWHSATVERWGSVERRTTAAGGPPVEINPIRMPGNQLGAQHLAAVFCGNEHLIELNNIIQHHQ